MKKNKSWFRYTVRDILAGVGQKAIYFDITDEKTIIGIDYNATVITVDKNSRLFRYIAFSNGGKVYLNIDRCIGRVKRGRDYA